MNSMRYSLLLSSLLFAFFSSFGQNPIQVEVTDYVADPSEDFSIDIKVSDFENVVGAQFTLKYDEEVINYLGVDNFGIATMNIIANFGIPAVENGTISFLWFDSAAQGVTLDDETTLFTVDFKAVGNNGEYTYVELDTSTTILNVIEFSNVNGEVIPVDLESGLVSIGPVGVSDLSLMNFKIGDMSPNIVEGESFITIESPANQYLNYTIISSTGQQISKGQKSLFEGSNTLRFGQEELPLQGGAYFIEFQYKDLKTVRKFIKM